MADQRFTVHGNTARPETFCGQRVMDCSDKELNLRTLQIFYKVCNGHLGHELILMARDKEEHGKAGGKI
jgi:hypothetical protein